MIFTIDYSDEGKRLDAYIAEVTSLSRSGAVKLIESGDITVFGAPVSKKYLLREGDEISVSIPEAKEYDITPEAISLNIVFEDDDIIVINKPSGMVVHPAPGNYSGTLVNALMYHCKDSLSGIGGVMRPGIVHRIDKDTSGLLVVAKNDFAHTRLSTDLERHDIVREYHALVRGGFKVDEGVVNLPIARHPVDRKRMAVVNGGKEAITHYTVLERFSDISYLRLYLETGRTHQIRVHMSHLGHHLLGDEVYAQNKIRFEKLHAPLFSGQMLHAAALTLTHPRSGERMRFECELPDNFIRALTILREESK